MNKGTQRHNSGITRQVMFVANYSKCKVVVLTKPLGRFTSDQKARMNVRMKSAYWLARSILLFLLFTTFSSAFAEEVNYRGFTVKFMGSDHEAVEAVVHKQIDKLLSVGLPDEMIEFFRTVPLYVSDTVENNPGHFTNGRVDIDSGILQHPELPVLIHEYMHALHFLYLPGRIRNSGILAAYEQAQQMTVYNTRSHMMSNVAEFFATTATSYLYGITAQEPFSREKVKLNQPRYFDYLVQLFGPQAGQYQGNLK
jgi:hypothetical protein